jgi:hypothetical protein
MPEPMRAIADSISASGTVLDAGIRMSLVARGRFSLSPGGASRQRFSPGFA